MLQFGTGLKRSLFERQSARKWVCARARAFTRVRACTRVRLRAWERERALPEVRTCIIMPLGAPRPLARSAHQLFLASLANKKQYKRSLEFAIVPLQKLTKIARRFFISNSNMPVFGRPWFPLFHYVFRESIKIREIYAVHIIQHETNVIFANISTLPTRDVIFTLSTGENRIRMWALPNYSSWKL